MSPVNRIGSLRLAYGHLDGSDLLRAICQEFPGRVAAVSSFGAESAVLLAMVAEVDPGLPVIFLDTGELFDETLAYRTELSRLLGLIDLRVVRPAPARLAEAEELWRSDPEACCHLRKVLPLRQAVAGFQVLVDGRKRFHGAERAQLRSIEPGNEGQLKLSPLASWSQARIDAAFDALRLPRHPLVAQGYRSIGCWPCSRPTEPGEPVRAGRWAGSAKTECGIHKVGTTL